MKDAAHWRELIDHLGLLPHPEGGYYRETFRSDRQVVFDGVTRSAGTGIYYLLAAGAYSAWHRIDADETWYFHAGTPLALHVLAPDGELSTYHLGNPLTHADAVFQASVPAGCWFAAELADAAANTVAHADAYALVGCSVAPGFEFSGFELAGRDDLRAARDRHGDWVLRLLSKS